MSETNQIIYEVGEEYGLTREEALELWNQYWNEFVLKKMLDMQNLSVIIKGLGTFFLKKVKLENRLGVLENIEKKGYAKERHLQEKELKQRLVKALEERNNKFKRKRIYG